MVATLPMSGLTAICKLSDDEGENEIRQDARATASSSSASRARLANAVCQLSDDEGQQDGIGQDAHATASSSSGFHAGATSSNRLLDITAMSDDEATSGKKRKRQASAPNYDAIRKQLNRALNSICRCSRRRKDRRNCLHPFRGKLDELVSMQLRLRKLHKLDMDREAA